jgi:23S rRNA (cytosine1962-C5)-methyltransferase
VKTIRCVLKEGKEKPLEGRHPWVFSGAIDQIDDSYETGDLVKVYGANEKFLGIGYLNPRSQIAIRMLAFEEVAINEAFFQKRIREALALRGRFISSDTNACRLIHSEGDFLPGLIVDRYADYLVVQFLTAGIDVWRETVVQLLQAELPVSGIFEKDDTEIRGWEGIEKRVGRLAGQEPPDFVEITENGIHFVVDIHKGQKTGFFLDQRDNRKLVGSHSQNLRVLNCFAYTGGFGLYAAKGGAQEVICVESSEPALNTARFNFEQNGFKGSAFQCVREDVFHYLRSVRQEFDLIILDPPAFCQNKQQIQQAARGYKDINLQALKRLAPGGLLFTSSCSSYISPDLFQKIIFGAAKDAKRDVRILAKTSHAFDHPINIYHPEGEYLKGLLCEVL